MKELTEIYASMGISPTVYQYGEAAIARLKERFEAIDQIAEYNQAKVLAAFRKNRVSATCFAASSGYGYNDEGRDKLEQVYADVFHTEAALVRPHITCGTHALTIALSANLLPGHQRETALHAVAHKGAVGTAGGAEGDAHINGDILRPQLSCCGQGRSAGFKGEGCPLGRDKIMLFQQIVTLQSKNG